MINYNKILELEEIVVTIVQAFLSTLLTVVMIGSSSSSLDGVGERSIPDSL
jgi:hypothetical protein